MMVLLFLLALSACSGAGAPSGADGTPSDLLNISAPSSDTLPEQNAPQAEVSTNCTFDPAVASATAVTEAPEILCRPGLHFIKSKYF